MSSTTSITAIHSRDGYVNNSIDAIDAYVLLNNNCKYSAKSQMKSGLALFYVT